MLRKASFLFCCSVLSAGVLSASCKREPFPKENFPRFQPPVSAALKPVSSCAELETQARDAAFFHIQEAYAWRLEQVLAQLRTANSKICQYSYMETNVGVPMSTTSDTSTAETNSTAQASTTNNQIAAVDEADIVKTDHDGQHIYVAKGNALHIFKSWPPEEAKALPPVPIEGQAKHLLKIDNKLLVISFVDNNPYAVENKWVEAYSPDDALLDPSPPFFSTTLLTLFDVSHLDKPPVELRKLRLHARFETARSVNNNAILVLSSPSPLWNLEDWYPSPCNNHNLVSERALRADYVRALNRAYANLLKLPMGTFGLRVEDSSQNQPAASRSCNNVFINPRPDGVAQLTVAQMDLSQNTPLETATILSNSGEIFVSKNNAYIAVPHWHAPNTPWFQNWDDQHQVSVVHKFTFQNGPPTYVASGIVKGSVLNAFSMDEDETFLRIATTTTPSWWTASSPQENILSILKQENTSLKLHGQLAGLALNEHIRSVRFVGNRAYVVTFRQTDPLFAIDLTDPQHPHVLGELKIPGFSSYMHPLGDTHLLTVGYDADENTGFTQGIQVQLFDISKPEALRLVAKHPLGYGSSSEAAQTHLGFAYDDSLKLLALPVTEGNFYYGYPNFEGVRLFCLNTQTGAETLLPCGQIEHPPTLPSPPKPYAPPSSSPVLRNIFMQSKTGGGNYLYSLSNNALFSTLLPSTLPPPEPTLKPLEKGTFSLSNP